MGDVKKHKLAFHDVTEYNYKELLSLNVLPEQDRFVGTVAEAIAEAYVDRSLVCSAVFCKTRSVYVGFLMYRIVEDDEHVHLVRLLVGHQYQSQGYGTAIMRTFEKRILHLLTATVQLAKRRCMVTLNVMKDNTKGMAFYQKLGFTEDTEEKDDDVVDDDHIHMWRVVHGHHSVCQFATEAGIIYFDESDDSLRRFSLSELSIITSFVDIYHHRQFGKKCCLIHELMRHLGMHSESPADWEGWQLSFVDVALRNLWNALTRMTHIVYDWFINKAIYCRAGAPLRLSRASCAEICVRGMGMKWSEKSDAFITIYRPKKALTLANPTDILAYLIKYKRIRSVMDVFRQWARRGVSEVCSFGTEETPDVFGTAAMFRYEKVELKRLRPLQRLFTVQKCLFTDTMMYTYHKDWWLFIRKRQ